jgi:MFS family permease
MPALALMTALWATAWMIVLLGGATLEAIAAASVFALAGLVFGLGECFQGPTQGALVADLAPPRLRGRYMALSTISWEIGFVIGPAIGGFVLDREPLALWPLAAGVCLLAGVGALALERGIPPGLRLTPA